MYTSSIQRFVCTVFSIIALSWLTACSVSTPINVSIDDANNDIPKQNPIKQPILHQDPLADYNGCDSQPTEPVKQACHQKNGVMQREGMMGCYMCVIPHSDAGTDCQDSTDCEGDCRVKQGEFLSTDTSNVIGECSANNSPFGCYQTIEDGVPQSALCVD